VASLMIMCPNTGQPISTGIETDEYSLSQIADVLARTRCPVCGLEHAWWKREAWLAAALPPALASGCPAPQVQTPHQAPTTARLPAVEIRRDRVEAHSAPAGRHLEPLSGIVRNAGRAPRPSSCELGHEATGRPHVSEGRSAGAYRAPRDT
jgi:hypothetical protein